VLVKARCTPIGARQIMAVDEIMSGKDRITDTTRIIRIIRTDGDRAITESQADARRRRISGHAALVERWRGMLKGKREAA
jgi:hypothetical protein